MGRSQPFARGGLPFPCEGKGAKPVRVGRYHTSCRPQWLLYRQRWFAHTPPLWIAAYSSGTGSTHQSIAQEQRMHRTMFIRSVVTWCASVVQKGSHKGSLEIMPKQKMVSTEWYGYDLICHLHFHFHGYFLRFSLMDFLTSRFQRISFRRSVMIRLGSVLPVYRNALPQWIAVRNESADFGRYIYPYSWRKLKLFCHLSRECQLITQKILLVRQLHTMHSSIILRFSVEAFHAIKLEERVPQMLFVLSVLCVVAAWRIWAFTVLPKYMGAYEPRELPYWTPGK